MDVFCINLPLSIFLMKGFINAVPAELEEAALIDGSGIFRCFWKIIFPFKANRWSTVAILDTLAIWNDFMTPLLFLQSPEKQGAFTAVYPQCGTVFHGWTAFSPCLWQQPCRWSFLSDYAEADHWGRRCRGR